MNNDIAGNRRRLRRRMCCPEMVVFAGDKAECELLREAMEAAEDAWRRARAGVDVARGDRYGKLALSEEGIGQRDVYVIESLRGLGLPLAVVLGGGYAASRERTVELHALAFRGAIALERRGGRGPQRA